MGWLITLGILAVIAILPVGVRGVYNRQGPLVQLLIGPAHLTLFPKGKNKKDKPAKVEEEPDKPAPVKKTGDKSGGSFRDFLPLVQITLDFLGEFRRKLRLNHLQFKLILGGGDPCDLAVNYGRAWTAIGNLMPHLERLFVIKKRDIEAECDFNADETKIFARLDITIPVGRLLSLVVRYGIRAFRAYLKIKNQRKGGAKI